MFRKNTISVLKGLVILYFLYINNSNSRVSYCLSLLSLYISRGLVISTQRCETRLTIRSRTCGCTLPTAIINQRVTLYPPYDPSSIS